MAAPDLVNLAALIDDAKCFALVRQRRWPEGVRCPGCGSGAVVRYGCDDTQPHRQRYRCQVCPGRSDDLTGTALAGRHQPLRVWVLCLYVMGLPLQPADRKGAGPERVRRADHDGAAAPRLDRRGPGGDAGGRGRDRRGRRRGRARGPTGRGREKGRCGRRRRLAGAPGRGTLAKDKPPILGLIERGGHVVPRMLADVQRKTIQPIIQATVARDTLVYTDEYAIYARLDAWGYRRKAVRHGRGEYARDEDGDGFREVHVNAMEGIRSLLRSWLRPHRGISQAKLPLYLAFFQFVHHARRRGKALLGEPAAALVA